MTMQTTLELMTTVEARSTVDRIKAKLEDVRSLLWDLHERKGWEALGYPTWQACIIEEFHMSDRHAHRLLNAHVVDQILMAERPMGQSGDGVATIPERHARELEPLASDPDAVREVYAEVVEQTDGQPTARALREAVGRRLGQIEPTERQAFMLQAMEQAAHLLVEPETEKAYYALSRFTLWLKLDPEDVAESAMDPAHAAPRYEQLAVWVRGVADALHARAAGLRVVK